MKANSENSFFLKRIPQSEYRRIGTARSDGNESYSIDLSLPALNLTDAKIKAALREKITEEGHRILTTLLPEETHSNIKAEDYLAGIFKKLGLSE